MAKQKLGDRVFGSPIVDRVVDACLFLIYAGWFVGCALAFLVLGSSIVAGFIGGKARIRHDIIFQDLRMWVRFTGIYETVFLVAAISVSTVVVLKGGRIFLNGLTEIRESL